MQKKIIVWTAILVVSIAVLAAGVTVMFNRAQPAEREIAIAGLLVASARRAISSPQQTVLYEASRDAVSINAYGFMEVVSQDKVLAALKATLTDGMRGVKIKVSFFPPREYLVEKQSGGREVSRLRKTDAIRQVELN